MLKELASIVVGIPIVIVDLMAEALVKLCRWVVPCVAFMTLLALLLIRPNAEIVAGAVPHFLQAMVYWGIAEVVWLATRYALGRLTAIRLAV